MDRESRLSGAACDYCRRRKDKCSKERPACQSCLRHHRPCHYSSQIVRSPLTRRHLTNVENRLQKLEALFARLLPNVDIEAAMSPTKPRSPDQSLTGNLFEDGLSPDQRSEEPAPVKRTKTIRRSPAGTPLEALPEAADGFDWKEEATDVSDLADGMAALSVEPSGIGYLGASSGVAILRCLLLWSRNGNALPQSPRKSTSSVRELYRPLSISQIPNSALSHQVANSLIDAYFTHYHTTYPFLHEATFRAQYSELVKRPEKHVWHMLLNTVLALGAWTIGEEGSDLDDVFYKEASRYSHDHSIFESASLSLVQALLLLSNYVQKRNKPNTGWNYLGLAVRMALSLGLHREFPEWNIRMLQREMRRRVWWGLLIFDSGASMTFGRAILLPESDMMDVKPVLNVPDEFLTPLTTTVPQEVDEPTLYSSLIAQSKFHLVVSKISNRLLSYPPISEEEALALNSAAELWATTLPWYFHPDSSTSFSYNWHLFALSRLWWRFWNLQIILTRPFLLQWAKKRVDSQSIPFGDRRKSECRQLCITSAHMTIDSVDKYIRHNKLSRLASWYTLYFLFHAALIPSVCLCADPTSSEGSSWKADINKTSELLTSAFSENPLATRCLEILDRLLPEPASDGNFHFPPDIQAQTDASTAEFLPWRFNFNDPINFLGWPEFG